MSESASEVRAADPETNRWQFEHDEGAHLYSMLAILRNWSGPLPSDMGLCKRDENMALMRQFMITASNISDVEGHEKKVERERKRLQNEAKAKAKKAAKKGGGRR